jgi:galactose mutarotase-like enzyme
VGEGEGSTLGVGEGCAVAMGVSVGFAWPDWPPHAAPASIGAAMRMATQRWEIEIRPERGGRITSLRLDGEELLDQGIGVDQPTANGFVEAGAFGWDEMVPTVEATGTLPDHGEAWRAPWEVDRDGAMRARGRVLPWELERRIALGAVVRVDYAYRNLGTSSHMAYWCAHPLFRYEPDMEIDLPIPRPVEGRSAKVFLPRASRDQVQLRWRSGAAVQMSWDVNVTPYVGVWVCNGDLGGHRQLAIEPATGGNDRPNDSAPAPLLAPGESLRWWLQIAPI